MNLRAHSVLRRAVIITSVLVGQAILVLAGVDLGRHSTRSRHVVTVGTTMSTEPSSTTIDLGSDEAASTTTLVAPAPGVTTANAASASGAVPVANGGAQGGGSTQPGGSPTTTSPT